MNKVTENEIESRFTYHAPKADQPTRYGIIRDFGRQFAKDINALCPDSREKTIALERLDEVVMWANAAIARNE
jgi:hypothetical protein